jgi:para-aminobenzoate synthetase component 1
MNILSTRLNPVSFFLRLQAENNICFLTSATSAGWGTLIAFNPSAAYASKADAAIPRFIEFVQENSARGRKLIGYFSYDLGYGLHNLRAKARDDLQLPDMLCYAFDNYIQWDGPEALIHYTQGYYPGLVAAISRRPMPRALPSQSTNFRPVMSRRQYEAAYQRIRRHIYDGDIYQINLTHRLEASSTLPPRCLFSKIIRHNPVDFLAYIEGDGFEILSASPERFVRVRNRVIETCPIKGTRPRGGSKHSDLRYRDELMRSRKEAAELNMITDLLRNDLGKVCKIGTVHVAGHRLLSRCPKVWHTYSRITGVLASEVSPVNALVSMLPGGSITGCPKRQAMKIIDEIEPTTRSIYTGAIGCITPELDLDFSVAIRTVIRKANRLYLQVGGGIVYDSSPEAEYQESLDKARSFMDILAS